MHLAALCQVLGRGTGSKLQHIEAGNGIVPASQGKNSNHEAGTAFQAAG